jgi:hypothetical protein
MSLQHAGNGHPLIIAVQWNSIHQYNDEKLPKSQKSLDVFSSVTSGMPQI